MRLWVSMCPRCAGDLFGADVGTGGLYVRCLRCGYDLPEQQARTLVTSGRSPRLSAQARPTTP